MDLHAPLTGFLTQFNALQFNPDGTIVGLIPFLAIVKSTRNEPNWSEHCSELLLEIVVSKTVGDLGRAIMQIACGGAFVDDDSLMRAVVLYVCTNLPHDSISSVDELFVERCLAISKCGIHVDALHVIYSFVNRICEYDALVFGRCYVVQYMLNIGCPHSMIQSVIEHVPHVHENNLYGYVKNLIALNCPADIFKSLIEQSYAGLSTIEAFFTILKLSRVEIYDALTLELLDRYMLVEPLHRPAVSPTAVIELNRNTHGKNETLAKCVIHAKYVLKLRVR